MKKQITNTAASVKARLLAIAKQEGSPFDEVLKLYGMERFLYRMSISRFREKLILKGALFFLVLDVPGRRTSLDIDLEAEYDNSPDKIADMTGEICLVPVKDDGIKFDPKTVTAEITQEGADYPGIRVKLAANIGQIRIPVQIDFGFGDEIYPKAKTVKYPVMLDFPAPKLKGYPAETVVSEKFESIVKLGDANSRMKDFYDLWLIFRKIKPYKAPLSKAIKKTFKNRHTPLPEGRKLFSPDIYDEKSDRQVLWAAFLKKNNIKNAPLLLAKTAAEIEKELLKSVKLIRE